MSGSARHRNRARVLTLVLAAATLGMLVGRLSRSSGHKGRRTSAQGDTIESWENEGGAVPPSGTD